MSDPNPSSIWSKVNFDLVATPAAAETPRVSQARTLDEFRHFWRWRRPLLDVVASALWLYALLKVFVADLDSVTIGSAVQYRFFFFLALTVAVALLLRKPLAILGGFLYVFGYPAVLLCWKLPKLLGKARSPVAFLAAANALTLLLGNVKWSVLAFGLAAFCTLTIVASHWTPLLVLAAAVLICLLVRTSYRTIRLSLAPSTFLTAQQKVIRAIVDSNGMHQLTSPAAELRSAEILTFSAEQQTTFASHLANGVIAHRILNYWAYQLERYRRSPASLIFNALSYLWLVGRIVLGLALLNLALFHAEPTAFTFPAEPNVLVFVRYVIAALYGGEISALHAQGTLANALSIVTFFAGLLVIGSLFVSSALAFRAARDESAIRETVVEIKREGARLEQSLRANYDVSVSEAVERLERLKYVFMGVITFLSTRIPEGFEDS
jgi:hypothetical protein